MLSGSFPSNSSNNGILVKPVRFTRFAEATLADHSVPSFVVGALLGPFCAGLIDVNRWVGKDDVGDAAYVSTPTDLINLH